MITYQIRFTNTMLASLSLAYHQRQQKSDVRFQVLTAASMIRIVFWDVLPSKIMSTDVSEVRAASIIRENNINQM
jgi:hypothetical protein